MENNPLPEQQESPDYNILYLVSYKWWRLYYYYCFGADYKSEHTVTLSKASPERSPISWDISLDNRQPERYDYVLIWPAQWEAFSQWYGRPLLQATNTVIPFQYQGKVDRSPLWLDLRLPQLADLYLYDGGLPLLNIHSSLERINIIDNFHIIRSLDEQWPDRSIQDCIDLEVQIEPTRNAAQWNGSGNLPLPDGEHGNGIAATGGPASSVHANGSYVGENPLPYVDGQMSSPPEARGTAMAPISSFRGLINDDGKSCYMSAVVQSLVHIPEFVRLLADGVDTYTFPAGIATELKNFFSEYFQDMATATALAIPPSFKEAIYQKNPPFRTGQQDVAELWHFLMQTLHEEVEEYNLNFSFNCDEPGPTTFIQNLFIDQRVVCIECPRCLRVPVSAEPLPLVALPYLHTGGAEIEFGELVNRYFSAVSEEHSSPQVSCQGCGQLLEGCTRRATLKLRSMFLVFQLPRNVPVDGVNRKDETPVRFPVRGLDLTPHAEDPSTAAVYDLHAVIYHLGTDHFAGHNTVDVSTPEGGWVRCDDVAFGTIGEEHIDFGRAYLLIYGRRYDGMPVDSSFAGDVSVALSSV